MRPFLYSKFAKKRYFRAIRRLKVADYSRASYLCRRSKYENMERDSKRKKSFARLLLPISLLLLIHLFFPHHHHYNSLHCEQEAPEQVCSVEESDALLRISTEPDSQCPAAYSHQHSLAPQFFLPLIGVLLLLKLLDPGQRFYFPPITCLYHAPFGGMIHALRAPPALR